MNHDLGIRSMNPARIIDEHSPAYIPISDEQAAETCLAWPVAERRAAQWLEENRAAADSSNAYIEDHGLPLAPFRNF
jgi:antitoxin CcdA